MRTRFGLWLALLGGACSGETAPSREAPPSSTSPSPEVPSPALPVASPAEPRGCPEGKRCVALAASEPESRIAEAFATATPGTVLLLGEGTFAFTNTLALEGDDVVVRGAGRDATVLDFRGQRTGSEGLLAEGADRLVLESFSVVDARGDGIKALGATDVVFRDLAVHWRGADPGEHGAYGIYPVRSKRVVVEDCFVTGASDAGIYIGQSEGTVLRRNRTTGNVAGIEVENSFDVDAYGNETIGNAQGLLVVDLPWVPITGGRTVRVHDNDIAENGAENFSPRGSFVGALPRGIGLLVLATDDVEAFGNRIHDNPTVNAAVASFLLTNDDPDNDGYDPYPARVSLHDNVFGAGGDAPDETRPLGALLADGMSAYPGGVVPSIVYDGRSPGVARVARGENPQWICLRANGAATFVNLAREDFDVGPHDCTLPPVLPEGLPQ